MRKVFAAAITLVLLAVPACDGSPPETAPPVASPENAAPSTAPETPKKKKGKDKSPGPDLRLVGDWEELGPDGFLELRLGMSQKEALRTGRLITGETVNGCTGFYLAMYGDGSGLGPHGYFSAANGLSVILGQDEMHTPEGIALEQPAARIEATYSTLTQRGALMTAKASDTAKYFFVSRGQSVFGFGLSLSGDPCLVEALGAIDDLLKGAR